MHYQLPISTPIKLPPHAQRPGTATRDTKSGRRTRLLLVAVTAAALLVPAQSAMAEPCAEPGTAISQVPWVQVRQPPQALWPVADGAGTRVAVLASGVDADHPQLKGRVLDGRDYLTDDSTAPDADCEGLGTQVAGVIAAASVDGIGFAGLAPKATIVPYRVSATPTLDADESLAEAVTDAADERPDVLVIPVVSYVDDPELRTAVADAIADDVVVVAATGDGRTTDGPKIPYPAAYDGVIGVAPIGPDGERGGDAEARQVTDLVGPGDQLVSTQVGGGLVPVAGSAVASGYVAGTVALIRSRWPELKAPDVVKRLLATATPMGDGVALVGPAQALTATMTNESPSPRIEGEQRVRPAADTDTTPIVVAGALAATALLVIALAVAVPRGRKRRWRPGLAPRPIEHPEDDEPEPPRLLFEDWTPGPR
ncbi:S8 family serine peptidase [Cryptosporangium sp. NPDC048952]|uniref:S8 family serine peptidase n=1 Tax=Cryptosporangium sp. NPDC048952 TaxID=3363961 RepID=UPI003723150D